MMVGLLLKIIEKMNIVLNIKRKFKPTLRNQVEFISAHFSDIDSLFESEADILEADIQISYMKPGKLFFKIF